MIIWHDASMRQWWHYMKHDGDASFISILIQFSSGSRAVFEHIAECENYMISLFLFLNWCVQLDITDTLLPLQTHTNFHTSDYTDVFVLVFINLPGYEITILKGYIFLETQVSLHIECKLLSRKIVLQIYRIWSIAYLILLQRRLVSHLICHLSNQFQSFTHRKIIIIDVIAVVVHIMYINLWNSL